MSTTTPASLTMVPSNTSPISRSVSESSDSLSALDIDTQQYDTNGTNQNDADEKSNNNTNNSEAKISSNDPNNASAKISSRRYQMTTMTAKSMKEKDNFLVYGYICNASKSLNVNIPSEIVNLLLEWFHIEIFFKTFNKDNMYSTNKRSIINNRSYNSCSVYGSLLMPSINDDIIYKYTMKIKRLSWTESIAIGIDEDECKHIDSMFYGKTDTNNYGIYDTLNEGDIVTMKYDAYNSTLSFRINGIDKGKIIENIHKEQGLSYCLAIGMDGMGAYTYGAGSVELLRIVTMYSAVLIVYDCRKAQCSEIQSYTSQAYICWIFGIRLCCSDCSDFCVCSKFFCVLSKYMNVAISLDFCCCGNI